MKKFFLNLAKFFTGLMKNTDKKIDISKDNNMSNYDEDYDEFDTPALD